MENCVAPGLDQFDVLLEVVLSLVIVYHSMLALKIIVMVPNIYNDSLFDLIHVTAPTADFFPRNH